LDCVVASLVTINPVDIAIATAAMAVIVFAVVVVFVDD
jgi:hypothetical protein